MTRGWLRSFFQTATSCPIMRPLPFALLVSFALASATGALEQSQRDCSVQPKVGAPAPTLGHDWAMNTTPIGVVALRHTSSFNLKHIFRPIRSCIYATAHATRPENRPCDDAPPVRRCIASPVRDLNVICQQPSLAPGC